MRIGKDVDALMRADAGADARRETVDFAACDEIRQHLADLRLRVVSGQVKMGEIVQVPGRAPPRGISGRAPSRDRSAPRSGA